MPCSAFPNGGAAFQRLSQNSDLLPAAKSQRDAGVPCCAGAAFLSFETASGDLPHMKSIKD